jgi:hypothetical protein
MLILSATRTTLNSVIASLVTGTFQDRVLAHLAEEDGKTGAFVASILSDTASTAHVNSFLNINKGIAREARGGEDGDGVHVDRFSKHATHRALSYVNIPSCCSRRVLL